MSLMKCTPCDCEGICPYDAQYGRDCEYWCGADEAEYYSPAVSVDGMNLTEAEVRTVLAVFSDCLRLKYSELNRFIGSEAIQNMQKLHSKLSHRDYCERHNIRFEDMTDEDFMQAYFERMDI